MAANSEQPTGFDSLLEAISREPVPAATAARLRVHLDEFRNRLAHLPEPAVAQPRKTQIPLRAAVLSAGLAGLVFLSALLIFPGRDDANAWAKVVQAAKSQPWIHATLQDKHGHRVDLWLSPQRQVAVCHSKHFGKYLYVDFRAGKLFEYSPRTKTVYESAPSSADKAQFTFLVTLVQLFSDSNRNIALKDPHVRLVNVTKREVRNGSRTWNDYDLVLRDSRRIPRKSTMTFRVDPRTRLPQSMIERISVGGKTVDRKLVFSYPPAGPADIYALGVPKNAKRVRRSGTPKLEATIAAINKRRSTTLEPYTAVVLVSLRSQNWKDIVDAYRIRRTASQLTIEQVDLRELFDLNSDVHTGKIPFPAKGDRAGWWKTQVLKLKFAPVKLTNPSSFALLPELVGRPLIGLPERSREVTISHDSDQLVIRTVTTEKSPLSSAYWIDPGQGHIAMRWEHSSPLYFRDKWIRVEAIDKLQQSPKGRWFATEFRRGAVENTGDALPTTPGVAPVATTAYRCFVEFDMKQD